MIPSYELSETVSDGLSREDELGYRLAASSLLIELAGLGPSVEQRQAWLTGVLASVHQHGWTMGRNA